MKLVSKEVKATCRPDKLGDLFMHREGKVYLLARLRSGLRVLVNINGDGQYGSDAQTIEQVFGGCRHYFTRMTGTREFNLD